MLYDKKKQTNNTPKKRIMNEDNLKNIQSKQDIIFTLEIKYIANKIFKHYMFRIFECLNVALIF